MKRYTFQSRPKELQETDVRVTTELSKENTRSLEEIMSLDPDTSLAFKEIKKVIYPICCSLPLLIYNLPEVIKVTLKNIALCPHSALQILQAVSRDVRQELAPFYDQIIVSLISLADSQNELLEEIFSCISISLKYVVKNLDCNKTLHAAIPLIIHKDAGIRHLASQSFSFLIRKNLDTLRDILVEVGASAWELVKYSVSNFSVSEVLACSWADVEAARLAHLSLAQDKKYSEALWDSISAANELSVLRDWVIICNGNTFPKSLLQQSVNLCKTVNDTETLTYIIKYHPEFMNELGFILKDQSHAFDCFKILSDFEDPHPELVFHGKLLHREYKNRAPRLNLTPYSKDLFSMADFYLSPENTQEKSGEALKFIIHCLESHEIAIMPLKNLNEFLARSIDNTLVWLGLRINRRIAGSSIPPLAVEDQYILREIALSNGLPNNIQGEILWSAAELNPTGRDNSEEFIEYLLHPALRVPAACLLQSHSGVMKIAWDITRDPADLDNEKQKITNLKRISHLFGDFPRAVCLFLFGLFWERFSTLWKHTVICLSEFGKKYPEILWGELSKLLNKLPEEPDYPELYTKYCYIREWAPPDHVLKNIIEVLIASPQIVNSHISEFTTQFLKFIEEEYLISVWLPTFPVRSEYSWQKPGQKLALFLKVFTVCKSLENIQDQSRLRKVLISLCTEKSEEIRSLAADALINMKGEEFAIRDFIRGIARDSTFRDTLLQKQTVATEAVIALCTSRVFHKSIHTVAALQCILNTSIPGFLLSFLPVRLHPDNSSEMLEIPINIAVNFLRTLKKILKNSMDIISDKTNAVMFLINLYAQAKTTSREVTNKAIACLNMILLKFTCPKEIIIDLVSLLSPVFATFSFDIRPKFIDLLHTLIHAYPFLHTTSDLLDPCISLLNNPKIEAKYMHKVLESLNHLDFPCTSSIISALIQALALVSLTPTLFTVFSKLPPSNLLTPLTIKLLPLCTKKPEIKELLILWLPFCEPPPIQELTNLVLKSEDCIPMLALCLPDPDGAILKSMGATRKKGLYIEKNYDLQLEALQNVSGLSFSYPRAILYALSHFMMSGDLGLRTSAGTAMLSFVNTEGLEEALTTCIKKARDEEQVRSVLNVWNKLDTPLSAVDPERSTILNLGHLQIHRRARAMGFLELATPKLVKKLIIPLLTFYLLYSSSKPNYQPSFLHTIVTSLGQQAKKLPWRHYYKLVKLYIKALKIDEVLSTKALASILSSIPVFEPSACQILKNKVMPVLKLRLCDKKDARRPKIRKFVAVALYQIIQAQHGEERHGELSRLLMILSRQYQHRDESAKESVISAAVELLKVGCNQDTLLREFNHSLDSELFALFATKILPTGLITVTSTSLPVLHRILLEYEQYASYYFIAKTITPELLPGLLASTRTLQYIVTGLSENQKITADDYISLALSLLNNVPKVKTPAGPTQASFGFLQCREDITVDQDCGPRNLTTFGIQPGAATGIRVKDEVATFSTSPEQVFGIRLLKLGVKKCTEMDADVISRCRLAAVQCLSIKRDEAVIGALEVLRIVGDQSVIPQVISVAERAGEDVVIHSLKTLSSLIRNKNDAENAAEVVLPQIIFALQSSEIQSSAMKLLKMFCGYKIMDEKIYDAIEEIPRIIISNPALAASSCTIYSQFLLTYPLSEKRRNFHIDFLVKNLGCVSSGANNGLLQALNVILDKFPYEELKEYCDFLLLSLVTTISNEVSEDFIEKYLKLAAKAAKMNSSSPIITKIFAWIDSENDALHNGCIRFSTMLLTQDICKKAVLQAEALSRVLESPPSMIVLGFLVAWSSKYGEVNKEIEHQLQYLLESGHDLSEYLVSTIEECSMDLLQVALKSIGEGTFTQGIVGLVGKASGEVATRRASAVARKLFGRNIEDSRVVQLLGAVLQMIKRGECDRTAMMKTLMVFSRSINSDIKEVLQDIFKELHIGVTQDEFLKQYTTVKDNIGQAKEEKKVKQKLMMVSDPELAARLKQKKAKKSRLLKKQRLLKIAPYKRIRVEKLIVTKDKS